MKETIIQSLDKLSPEDMKLLATVLFELLAAQEEVTAK